MKNVRILHTRVGAYPEGYVVTWDDFKALYPTASLTRLVSIGAVEVVNAEPSTDALPASPENPNAAEPESSEDADLRLLSAEETPVEESAPIEEELGQGDSTDVEVLTPAKRVAAKSRTKVVSRT